MACGAPSQARVSCFRACAAPPTRNAFARCHTRGLNRGLIKQSIVSGRLGFDEHDQYRGERDHSKDLAHGGALRGLLPRDVLFKSVRRACVLRLAEVAALVLTRGVFAIQQIQAFTPNLPVDDVADLVDDCIIDAARVEEVTRYAVFTVARCTWARRFSCSLTALPAAGIARWWHACRSKLPVPQVLAVTRRLCGTVILAPA